MYVKCTVCPLTNAHSTQTAVQCAHIHGLGRTHAHTLAKLTSMPNITGFDSFLYIISICPINFTCQTKSELIARSPDHPAPNKFCLRLRHHLFARSIEMRSEFLAVRRNTTACFVDSPRLANLNPIYYSAH